MLYNRTSKSISNRGPYSIKSQQPSAKITAKNETQKGKGANNSTVKRQQRINVFSQKGIMEEERTECKDHTESMGNKCCEDMDHEDSITVLRKEIQDWRINEILTARSEDRLTGTPSEQRSYVASGETTKRQRSSNNPSNSCRSYVEFPEVTQ